MKKVYLLIVLCCLSFCGFAQAYCTPSFGGASTACSVGINFTKFQITGVSGTSINDLGVCNGTTNYTNNAGSMSVSLSRGSTYSVSLLSSGSFAIDVQVWIDFNDDFNFDGSETVGGMTNYVSPATINLIIPGGANLGAHRMRIIGNYTGCCGGLFYPSINSCGTAITYGEARDYTVNIGVSNDAPVFSNGATQSILVCLSAAPVSLDSVLQVSDGDAGQTVTWSTAIAPAHGTLIATYSTTSAGGVLTPFGLTFTPTPGYSGTDVFAVTVSDGLASSTTTVAVNINVIAAITGTTTFPVGYNTTLFNPTAGGSWSSGNTAVATAGSTGVISGVSIGTATISYSKSTACGVLHSTRDVSVVAYATSPIITTFAGINAYGYSGNGGPATFAMLNTAHGLAIDAAGNVYIADYSNHAIRKVNTAGIISTIAGTNVSGYTGDGGPASAAMLNRPTKLCFDAAGNLYFTDQQCVIRKISTTGIITTVAGNGIMASSGDGGPASAASFHDPYGICIDAGGNIYVGEYQGYRVRKISAGGTVSTFTGNGTTGNTGDGGPASAAAVGRPIGLCIDGGGNILIADSYNNVIRKVNTSGIISTVAGNGGWGYTGDGGPATAATLNLPWDVTVDALGNIIIGDLYNHMVRKVNASGIISTLSGTGTAGITGDNGPATAAKLNHPYAVVTDGAGNIYIGTNTTVRKIGSTSATSPTNRAPAFVNGTIQSATACSGTVLAISSLLPVHDSDASQTETWTVNVAPLNGSLSGFNAIATSTGGAVSPTGTFYTSTAGFSGLDTFTIKVSDGTDTAFTTIVVTVNPASPITGASGICQGNTMSLSNATPGGAWSSSNTSLATVGTTGVVSGIGAGTAIISYALPSGCIATAVVTIYATPAAITGTLYVCQGTTSALSSDLSGGFWMSGNTSVATINSSTGLASGMSPGTASITYTMGTGCQTFSVMTVIASPAAISGTTTVCAGANTTLSSTPGGGFWSSSNTAIATIGSASGIVTGVAGGTVLISYTNSEGCTIFTTVTVNPAAVAGTISGASAVCTGASTGLTNTVTGGTWSSSNNLVATVNSFASVSGIAAGTVIISYSKSNSCGTTVATKAMTVNPTPVAGTITGTATLCTGSSTTLSNPTGTVGGIWTSAATGIATVGSLSGIVSGVSAGTATISYSINNTCGSVTATRIVTVSILTAGTLSSSGTLCAAATNTLTSTVTGGTWTSANTAVATIGSSTGVIYGVTSGTTTISYTVSTACGTATQTMVLTVDALPALTLAHGTSVNVCPGESLLLSTDSLGSFDTAAVTSSTSFLNSPEASGPTSVCDCPPGYVVVGYSGQTGAWLDKFNLLCRQFSDGVLTGATVATAFNGASTATPSGPYIFGGSTIMVGVQMHASAPYFTSMGFLAGIKGYGQSASYIHSTGVNAISPSSLTTMIGYYSNSPLGTLFVPDGNVITGMNSYNNYYATGISLRYRPISSFYTTGASWTSSNPAVATVSGVGVVSGISIGTAIITYSATNSCGTTDSLIYVTVGTGVDAGVISGDSIVVTGDSTMLTSSVGGGTWSVSNANASITTTGMLTGVSAGTVVVSYSVSGACGTDVAIYGVTVMSDIDPITGPSVFCQGSDVTLSSATAGGTWSSGNTAVATVISTSGLVTGVSAGTAVISYTTAGGFVTLIVSVLPLPVITGTASVCIGGSETLFSSLSGGMWSSGNTTVATVGSSTGVVLGISSGTVSINYTSFEGCTAAFFFTVNTMPSPISVSVPICEGASIVLESTPSGGAWTTGNMSIATVDVATGVLTGISAGTTSVTYVTTSGCTTSTIVTVNASPGTIGGTLSVCIGNTTSLSSSPSGGTWTSGNTSKATVDAGSGLVTGVSTGNADITYTLAGGCRRKVTVTVIATPAAITGALSLCAGSTTALSSATTGGSWSSAATGVATVDAGTGVVTGISTGTTIISYSNGSCAATVIVTVNASAGANTGTASVCIGSSSSLSNATTGGTWSSSDAAIATVHASTGLVTGVSTGVVNITYTATPGCYAITSFTVNATVAAITGTMTVCPGETTSLSSATSGGTWSSSNTARATIEAGTGVVTGVSGGTVTISYIVGAGCSQTAIVTVNTSPAGISGTATICEGASTTLTCSPSGGTWSSSSAAATVGSSGIVTGVSAGTATIAYTAGTGCAATRELTVNATPTAITGSLGVCVGNTSSLSSTPTGGTWAVTFTTKVTVGSTSGIVTGVAVGTTPVTYTAGGCLTTATVSVVTTPAAIGGTLAVCAGSTTSLTSATTGGTWTSSNTGVATVVSGTGVVTGISSGTVVISYSNGSCATTRVVTVNAALSANSGSSTVCVGQGTDLNNATSGGTWSSSNTAIATVNATTGLVVGVSAGTVNISYRVGAGCFSITEMTVNATLSSITGTATVCPGATTALSHAVAGGVWTSGIPARATIDAGTGVVTGVSAGTVYITYAVGGCFTTRIVTVSAAPGAIGGTASVCEGGTITLTCSPTGGTWSSTVPATATVSGSGVVTGISAGTTTISYTRLGCAATRMVTVTSAPAAIGGTLSACIGTTTTLTSSPAGGTWSSSNPARFTVVAGTGVVTGVSAGTATVTYAMSATCRATAVVTINASAGAISGSLTVCETCTSTLSSATTGGVWSSSNTAAATIGAGTGVVSGVGIGSTTISYVAGGCSSSAVVTVIAAIPSSFGTPVVCVGQTNATMGNPVAGGTWSSSNTSLATIHATTGLLTGIAVGNPNLTYTTSPGVYTITIATVSAAVANITGTAAICPGATVALSNATTGGTWSSTNTARATVDAGTGVVTGVAAGTVTISYTINVGCYKAITQTVNAAPNVTGAANVVNGASTTFGGSPGGGTWSSANPAIASVSGTGVVTGNSVAATTITYTLPATGCFGTRSINVVAARAGSPSGAVESAGVLKVFPNPTSGTLTIDAPINGTFTVYTIDGKEVVVYKVGESALTVSLPQQLAAGVYMCRFNGADGTSAIVRLVYER